MPQLSAGDETLSFSVEGLEGLHKVSESTCVLLLQQFFVQWNEFFEFIGFLT